MQPGVMAHPSLRTELLLNLAVLAAAALALAIPSALLAPLLANGPLSFILLVGLVIADVGIIVVFGRYLLTRLVTRPVEALVAATEAVAGGEFERRAPAAATRELDALAGSVNRMTERLLDAQGALVRAEKLASVGRLAAGIAHEVGNPLAAIANYAEVLRRRGVDPEIVQALEREADRIDTIVRGLLDYARPSEAARDSIDLTALVAGAVELLRTQGLLRALDVREEADGAPSVRGDSAALEQVLVNLLLNAVDAAGTGGRIRVRTEVAPSGRARVIVADSGPGVPETDRARVFDPFFTTKPPGRGTGLGLAIVQRVVEDHGGTVVAERAPEGGAAFVVTLPAEGS
jgi:two-component system, NtrC family, sensor kinase